jgi:hypothetical protein
MDQALARREEPLLPMRRTVPAGVMSRIVDRDHVRRDRDPEMLEQSLCDLARGIEGGESLDDELSLRIGECVGHGLRLVAALRVFARP